MKLASDRCPFPSQNIRAAAVLVATIAATFLLQTSVHATLIGFDLGDAENYGVIFEGGSSGSTLNINNGAGVGHLGINGNIGIAGTGKLGLAGPLTIDGNIDFAGSVNPSSYTSGDPYVNGNITVNGAISGGHNNVQTDMNSLNTLSQTLGGETGTAITLKSGTTINANAGTLDAQGNRVFTANQTDDLSGGTGVITINGDGSHKVVINVTDNGHGFHAHQVVLTGGLKANDIIWNYAGGNATTLSGGQTLSLNSGYNGAHPDDILTGIFLDPFGTISMDSTELQGHIYGGDTHNMQLVSGEYLISPTPDIETVPDATSTILLLAPGFLLVAAFARKRAV